MSKASLSITSVYREGGVGIVLEVVTVSAGKVKPGFEYRIEGQGKIKIKSFDNNFLPIEYEHPSSGILILVSLDFDYKNLRPNMVLVPG